MTSLECIDYLTANGWTLKSDSSIWKHPIINTRFGNFDVNNNCDYVYNKAYLEIAAFNNPQVQQPVPYIKPKCDCGAATCKTTHAHWCSTKK